jgi:hypothetical protein
MPNPFATRSPERRRRLRALAAVHAEWVSSNLDSAEFDADRAHTKTPSDYNVNYLDVNPPVAAEDDFQLRASAAMGFQP